MRSSRHKIAPSKGAAAYHCISQTVNGEKLFDATAMEVFRKQLWQVVEFCGLTVVTYSILADHFHVLVYVPKRVRVDDTELLRRYRILHPYPTERQAARIEVIERNLAAGNPQGKAWRKRQLALMGDVSRFMQLLKQRFSIWFNKTHDRFGTLWAERFKSVLAQPASAVLLMIALYIDLNGVSRSIVADPKDYRFCGYAEAMAGNERARQGLCLMMGEADWTKAHAAYRQLLFSVGAKPHEKKGRISLADYQRVIAEGGKLPLGDVLRCRLRYFTDGAVLGSRAFVQTQLAADHRRTGRREKAEPQSLPPVTDWGELAILRKLRGPVFE